MSHGFQEPVLVPLEDDTNLEVAQSSMGWLLHPNTLGHLLSYLDLLCLILVDQSVQPDVLIVLCRTARFRVVENHIIGFPLNVAGSPILAMKELGSLI